MTEDARREDLRRAAFGRPDGDTDGSRAAEARELLARLDSTSAAPSKADSDAQDPGAQESAVRDSAVRDEGAPPLNHDDRPPRRWPRRAVAGALVIGLGVGSALGVLATDSFLRPTVVEGGTTIFVPDGEPLPAATVPAVTADDGDTGGDPETAALWFDRPQTEADLYPFEVAEVAPLRTRLVSGAEGRWRLWVADRADGVLCLLAALDDPADDGARLGLSTCATPDDFRESGLTLISGSDRAHWDGVTVESTSQYQAE